MHEDWANGLRRQVETEREKRDEVGAEPGGMQPTRYWGSGPG
jgi:hypothetical protein